MNEKIMSITVTFNPDIPLLERQLKAIAEQVYQPLIVDNGSSNVADIVNLLNRLGFIKYFRPLNRNYGLAKAQNVGIEVSVELGATHVILFDQDSVPERGFVDGLASMYQELLSNGINVGAIGPTFYDPESGEDYFPTLYKGPFIVKRKSSHHTRVTFLIASGCYFSLATYKNVGVMCEELFVDYIDIDWSLRCSNQGYELYMTDIARMEHSIGDNRITFLGRTMSSHSPLRRYYLIRNSFYMLKRDYVPFGYKIREVCFNLFRTIIGICTTNQKLKMIKYAFKGLCDGLRGNYGAYK